ncbi:MAG: single-stranded-DNA-specific exonuclease [Thermoleophilaceae bacterium]|nr:single-stranded-DNA-specific exonuclease [Thermoleophilaceae bacterium]
MSLPDSRWRAKPYPYAAADAVSRELDLSPVTASILARRGCDTPARARAFLASDERHSPSDFAGIDTACDLILGHAGRGSRIVIHGDYDVDGVASTAILIGALRELGADPDWLLPSRFEDGYGLSRTTVDRLAAEGTGLLITTDCAITAVDEVAHARALGVDVVVTDHHRPAERLPDCPIVHPVISGYPFPDLCAAGVAYKLAEALYARAGRDPRLADADLDLVALATIADLVPLKGENRRLVREGLEVLARTEKPGLRELMKISRVDPAGVDAHAVGFRLAPRINAAGRLQRADAGLELVLTRDGERATAVADELDMLNRERQDTETRLLFAAEAARAEQPDDAPAFVLAGEGWHPGVIGIVASRIVDRHHRPTVLIALDGESGRGSGRSISAYDLHAGLASASEHLIRFGGHRAAAGLEIERGNVEAFRQAFMAHAAAALSPADLIPEERVDAVVPGGSLGLPLCEELRQLAPFGFGNPQPTLLVPAARIADVRGMGQDQQHSSFGVVSGGSRARAVAFRTSPKALTSRVDAPQDVAVRIELNEWNGRQEARLVLRAVCATAPGTVREVDSGEGFWVAFERELRAPLEPALVAAGRGGAATLGGAAEALPSFGAPARRVVDRRGQGFAGVAGDLIASGESLLVVCADVARRRDGLERTIAGLGGDDPLPETSWDALAAEPSIASDFVHLVALDPPLAAAGEDLLAAAPGDGFAHLAWGAAESEFALAVARAGLDLRPALVVLYRALRDRPAAGADLEEVLRGDDGRRTPQVAARLVRVLSELGLVAYERDGAGRPACRVLDAPRTALERSAAYRAYMARLAEAERRLAPDRREAPPAVAAAAT